MPEATRPTPTPSVGDDPHSFFVRAPGVRSETPTPAPAPLTTPRSIEPPLATPTTLPPSATPEPPVRRASATERSTAPPTTPEPTALPTIVAPSPAPAPTTAPSGVRKSDGATYILKAGDSFRSISEAAYKSPDYAAALQEYNQTFGLKATNQAGQFAVGDMILLPDITVLEARLRGAVLKPAPMVPAPTAPMAPAPTVPSVPPTPMGAAPTAPTAAFQAYVVKSNDEWMAGIAKKTLGKEELWSKIAALNPGVPQNGAIPTGTKLVMPADAIIPYDNLK
jgi:nucleoid-associated protein YgaU